MSGYTLQSSLEARARKSPGSLDIVSSKKIRPILAAPPRAFRSLPPQRGFDGARSISPTLKMAGKKRSFKDTTKLVWQRRAFFAQCIKALFLRSLPRFTPHKMLYGSLIGGVAFGMVSMAFMEHYFGPGVFARSAAPVETSQEVQLSSSDVPSSVAENYNPEQDIFFEYFSQVTKEKYEDSIREMVKGYPIESMLPYIFSQDRLTAAFLVGIAKKESNWGKRVPVLDDQDCFNYWGYRGVRRMMGSGGHTCFNSRKDAVETVATRLNKLIHSEKLNTPEKMIVWKCGFSCEGHSRESVKKWISDVDIYFSQLSEE